MTTVDRVLVLLSDPVAAKGRIDELRAAWRAARDAHASFESKRGELLALKVSADEATAAFRELMAEIEAAT